MVPPLVLALALALVLAELALALALALVLALALALVPVLVLVLVLVWKLTDAQVPGLAVLAKPAPRLRDTGAQIQPLGTHLTSLNRSHCPTEVWIPQPCTPLWHTCF